MNFPLLQAACTLIIAGCMVTGHAIFSRAVHGTRLSLYALPVVLFLGFILWNTIFFAFHGSVAPLEIFTGYSMFGFLAVGYMELFLNLYRGLSYTLIADIASSGGVTQEKLCRDFADGIGASGMIERRFKSMEGASLIRRADATVYLLPCGVFFARLSLMFRSFLRLEKGGGEFPAKA